MKKLFVALMLMPLMALAETEKVNGITWTFTVYNDKAEVGNSPSSATGAITIPSTLGGYPVTSIGNYAFYNCRGLTSVTIPSSVTSIGDSAFYGCSGLTSVTIPSSVTSIGSLAFYATPYLEIQPNGMVVLGGGVLYVYKGECPSSVTIPSSVTSIGDSAFSHCSGLTSITIPSSVTSIGDYAFSDCGGLTSVTIPSGVTSIGDFAFLGCSGLTSVTISSSVTSIGDLAFVNCSALKKFWVDGTNPYYSSRNGFLCTKDGNVLVAGVNGEVEIPSSVTRIGSHAFLGYKGLTAITIPSGVTGIEADAFANCHSLKKVNVDSLSFWGEINFATKCSNPLDNAEAKLYVQGGVVEDVVKVTFKLDDDYVLAEFYDAEWGVMEKTIEIGIGCPVWPPEIDILDANYEMCGWDKDLQCVMNDMEVHPVYDAADIETLVLSSDLQGSIDRVVYDITNGCVRVQGIVPLCLEGLDNPSSMRMDERMYKNLRMRLVGCDEHEEEVCHVEASRWISDDGLFAWSGMLPVDTNVVRAIDVVLISTWYKGECCICRIPISEIDCRVLGVRKIDLSDLRDAEYTLIGHRVSYFEEVRTDFLSYQRKLGGERCEAVYEFSDREGLSDTYGLRLNDVSVDLSEGSFVWITEYDSASPVTNQVCMSEGGGRDYYQKFIGNTFVSVPGRYEFITYTTIIPVEPQKYYVRFNLGELGTRIGGGDLGQEIDSANGESEVMPDVEPNHGYLFLGWRKSHWDEGVLIYVAEYTRKYDISYLNTKCVVNPNPTNYTVTNEIVFAALADTDEYWFKGWEPAKIEVGTTGDLVVTAKWDRVQSVAEAAGDQSREWASSGDADWFVTWNDEKGQYVVRSGEIGHNQISVLETVVINGGTVSFDVKVSCEGIQRGKRTDGLTILVDGAEKLWLDGEVGWTNVTIAVTGEGEHRIKWKYSKDVEGAAGDDCAYLANFKFYHQVVVSFDGGGATVGEVPSDIVSYNGGTITLPEVGIMKKINHSFAGWSDGVEVYQPGEKFVLGDVPPTFTAVWSRKELESPVIDIPARYETERTTVAITAVEGATIRYTVDGSDPLENGLVYRGPFEVAGSLTVRAVAVRDDWYDSAVVEASTVRAPWGYAECLNCEDVGFTSGGDSAWVRDLLVSHDGTASVRSGKICNNETNWLEATVIGAGTLSFWWKASAEMWRQQFVDFGTLWIDGVEQLGVKIGNHDDWRQELIAIKGGTRHTIRWVYSKDVEDAVPFEWEDCIWLDEVMWHPALPSVADDAGATVTGDAETGFVVKPSEGKTAVEVTIPQGVDAAKVTVEVSPKVERVTANGAKVKILNGSADITEFLDVPAADADGVVDLTKATVKEEIVKEAIDVENGATVKLNATEPIIMTTPTKPGLVYTFREGTTLEGLGAKTPAATKIGDGEKWTLPISVRGGKSAFYLIGVGK